MPNEPLKILQKVWGFPNFRASQQKIINNVLRKNDTLALLATGGGKSICFQIPALLMDGICLVVSPLIALMEDQIQSLKDRNIKALGFTNKTNTQQAVQALKNTVYNGTKFIYIAPERLRNTAILENIKALPINLIAIDEAHCISQWGHDFRMDYLKLGILKDSFFTTPIIALTATATQTVVVDICKQLSLKNVRVFKDSFERKNLAYRIANVSNKYSKLLEILKQNSQPSIVYTHTRASCENIARWLKNQNISCGFYHGGLDNNTKKSSYESWKNEQNICMVATNAFGMGIDKKNIQTIIHFNLPYSLENYMQEAGRAGRDGNKAVAITLLNAQQDAEIFRQKIARERICIKTLKKIWVQLHTFFGICKDEFSKDSFAFDTEQFCKKIKYPANKTFKYLNILHQYGLIYLEKNRLKKQAIQIVKSPNWVVAYCKTKMPNTLLLETLLRYCPGIFNQMIFVSNQFLSEKIKQKPEAIILGLKALEKQNIIQYQSENTSATLKFLVPRQDDLNINPIVKKIKHQESLRRRRLSEIWRFVSRKNACRSQMLLKYFEEKNVPLCGICDYCEEIKATVKDENVSQQILKLFQENGSLSLKRNFKKIKWK